jgi:predicted  nucleic acid-binding Zn-ribbon protein
VNCRNPNSSAASSEAEIEETRDQLAATEAELDAADATIEETREEQAELKTKLEELRDARDRLETIRYEIDTQEESITSLRQERTSLKDGRADLSEPDPDHIAELDAEITRLRNRKQRLQSEITELQNTIQFNEETLEGGLDWTERHDASQDGAVTDQLLEDSKTVTCWTCGSDIEDVQIRPTLDHLRERRQEKLDTIRTLEDQLEELIDDRDKAKAAT